MKKYYKLQGPSFLKSQSNEVRNIIIMLHGYGSNGNDLIQLAYAWGNIFPNIYFSAPDAPFNSEQLPGGFKWFEAYPNGLHFSKLSGDLKKDVIKDFQISIQSISEHIEKLSKTYNLKNDKIFLLGFSQGSMMSIDIATKSINPFAGIIFLSGKIFYPEDFFTVERYKNKVLVIHGDRDEVIPPTHYYETCKILNESKNDVQQHLIKDMSHSISTEVIEFTKKFIQDNL